ncbi:beta-eliminating lyase-related protein [Alphaproteobacteria bacterium]|nr:beta-eliminating lyase-related protein [Alphaproteobacteria bacterium]
MPKKIILMGTDTVSGVAPEILDSIIEVSKIKTLPYGNDIFTKECREKICKIFQKDDIEILPMMSGSASNSLAISSFLRSYGSVLCHSESHINKDEGGAPEFFSSGGKLISIFNQSGKIIAEELNNKINSLILKGPYNSRPSGVSITQLLENGTIYSIKEIKAISDICKKHKLFLHMDGARFSNAMAFQESLSPADATWKIGIDCLSLGATKNGAMAAEVIIFFNSELAKEARNQIKQTGHLISKTRFISAQLNAWLNNGLWLTLAKSANEKAIYLSKKLSTLDEFQLLYPTEGNEIFFKIKNTTYKSILELNIIPNLWNKLDDEMSVIRFVTSFETEQNELDELISRIYNKFN